MAIANGAGQVERESSMKEKLPNSFEKWKRLLKEALRIANKMERGNCDDKDVLLLLYDLRKATYKFSHDFEQTLPLPNES